METVQDISLRAALLDELKAESATTKEMLSRIPEEKYSWQPHPKSMTLNRLATHVAELPSWIGMTIQTNELNFDSNSYVPKDIKNQAEMMKYFEDNLTEGIAHLENVTDDQLSEIWTMRNGDQIYMADPKWKVIRMTLSQVIHHRAQLGVYLRLLDQPIPGSYGPSADEDSYSM